MQDRIMDEGIKEAKFIAKDVLDRLDVNELVRIAYAYVSKEKTLEEIEEEYGPKYRDAAISYAKVYGKDKIMAKIKETLDNCDSPELKELATDDFAESLIGAAIESKSLITRYLSGEIDEKELMTELGNGDIAATATSLLMAYGVNPAEIAKNLDAFKNAPIAAATYACLIEAYNIYMKCLNDALIQYDHRVEIEKKCSESIKAIYEYRKQMEENINHYFENKYDSFERGIVAMNESILKNDSDGYIKGSNEIQSVLGYKPQFSNQKEFDDLMESDMDFKL